MNKCPFTLWSLKTLDMPCESEMPSQALAKVKVKVWQGTV